MPNHVHGILELTHQPKLAALPAGSPINIDDMNAPSTNDKLDRPFGAENNSPDISGELVAANKYSPDKNNSPDNNYPSDFSGNRIGANSNSPLRSPSKTVGSIVRGYKIGVTKWMRQNTPVYDVWQRNYYENIIRDWAAYQRIAQYIRENPTKWNDDGFSKK
jgi:REP element-mobilizing transposase RayT